MKYNIAIEIRSGCLEFFFQSIPMLPNNLATEFYAGVLDVRAGALGVWDYLGHFVWRDQSIPPVTQITARVPMLILEAPWLLLLFHLFRSRKPRRGVCQACGYDLRASTGPCPECGEANNQEADAMASP